jgi:inosine-uridine nucleoside N-ribohydrolase
MAIKLEPRIVERIPETIIMGGGHEVGNTTPAAEFNIWVDPEAARVVFGAGLRNVVVMPLDATHRALVSLDDCRLMRGSGTPAGEAAAAFIERRIAAYDALQPMAVAHTAPVHDALCVAYLIDPTIVSGRSLHVDVETHGELTIGRTVMDTHVVGGKEPNAFVAFDADAPRFVAMLVDTFGRR